jgi:hypothetical protein
MQSETEDRWYVEVGGAPKMMTLDELVEAFEAGTVNSKTLVCEVGGAEWKPLSEVADLGDEEEAPASQQAPSLAPAPVVHASLSTAPLSQRPVPVGGSSAFPAAVARPAAGSAWPPAVNASRPPSAYGSSVPPAGTASPSVVPPSMMPVVQDLSVGLDDDFKPRRSKAPIFAAAAVLLLVGGALGVARFGGGGEIAAPVPVPAAAPVPVETVAAAATTPPAPATAPTPAPSAEEKTASAEKPSDASDSRLSDDVKSKLKDADKTRVDKKKAGKASRGHAVARSKGSSSGVFRAGGNVNDPLNSSL